MSEGAPPKFITMIEPTYRTEPAADKMFNVDTAKGIIKGVLEEIFVEDKYEPEDLREKVIEANNEVSSGAYVGSGGVVVAVVGREGSSSTQGATTAG